MIKFLLTAYMLVLIGGNNYANPPHHFEPASEKLVVKKCIDFSISGDGKNEAWTNATWHYLTKLDTGATAYTSRFKMMYSSKGIYVLFNGTDTKISTCFANDFDELYRGDVFEVFLRPDTLQPMYFEYEINQLNAELALLVPNINGRFFGWAPTLYKNERKVKKMVTVTGGKAEPDGAINDWTAEVFIPYGLLTPLPNVPPVSGSVWKANFYRLDYDSGNMIKYAWSPVEKTFHEIKKFRSIQFE